MKKFWLLLILMSFNSAEAVIDDKAAPNFVNLIWYTNINYVKSQLAARGYSQIGVFQEKGASDYRFSGITDGYSVSVTAVFNDIGLLVGTTVVFKVPPYPVQQYDLFNTYANTLETKYGKSYFVNTTASGGDSTDFPDLISRKALYYKVWKFDKSGFSIFLSIQAFFKNKEVLTGIDYISPLYVPEIERRTKASDF